MTSQMFPNCRIHPTADVSPQATIGEHTSIWQHCQVRERAKIGMNCVLGKGVYVDLQVNIGDNVKIQNYVSIYHGVTIEDGVFIGPHVCFTNDRLPRAINPDGSLKAADDWELSETYVQRGASIGANATIRCGIQIGEWAMIGAGSVVTRDVPDYGLVYGNPALLRGYVCVCGDRLVERETDPHPAESVQVQCEHCGRQRTMLTSDWLKINRSALP